MSCLCPAIEIVGARCRVGSSETDVIDPFHDDDVRDAGLHQHVAIESRQGADTSTITQHLVATDAAFSTPTGLPFRAASRRAR